MPPRRPGKGFLWLPPPLVAHAAGSDPPREIRTRIVDEATALMGQTGRKWTIPVEGESMIPTLHGGDHLAVDFAPRRIRFGDILVFRQGGKLVVHRVVGRVRTDGGARFRTRGDGRPVLDRPVAPGDVKGRVIAVRRGARWYDLNAAGARLYARALGTHDLFWAGAAAAAGRAERLAARLGLRLRIRYWVTVVDAGLLRRADRWLFPRFHRLGSPPEGRDGEAPGDLR